MHVNNLTIVAPDIGAKHYGIGSGVSKLIPFWNKLHYECRANKM